MWPILIVRVLKHIQMPRKSWKNCRNKLTNHMEQTLALTQPQWRSTKSQVNVSFTTKDGVGKKKHCKTELEKVDDEKFVHIVIKEYAPTHSCHEREKTERKNTLYSPKSNFSCTHITNGCWDLFKILAFKK